MKFLSPDCAIAFSGDFANKTKTKHKTTISVHEFLSDSTFNYPIILLFEVRFSNNFILFFYFTVTITSMFTYLFTYKPDVNIGRAGETKDTKFLWRPARSRLHLRW